MKRNLLLLALSLASASPVRADVAADKSWNLTFRQKVSRGNQDYRASDTFLDASLPYGLDLNVDLSAYANASSSTTPTITLGAGWTNDAVSYFASYAVTTLANDYEANAVDGGVSVRNDSDDFRTKLTADVNVAHHRSFLRFPKITNEQDLTQKTPTLSLSQRLFDNWEARAAISESNYNRDLLVYTRVLNQSRTRAQRLLSRSDGNLVGLVDGFPDWTAKFGLDYAFDALPLTLRGTYESIHLVTTAQVSNATADLTTYSVDYDLGKWATLTAEYDHTRQTSQPRSDVYSVQLAVRY